MLPKGWVEADLIDIITLHDSKRIPLNAEQRRNKPGDYAYYGANGQVGAVGEYIFDGEYILLAEDGGFFDQPGRRVAYQVLGKFWVNNHAHILTPKGGIPQTYLCKALNHFDWMAVVGGTTRLKLTQGNMKQVKMPLPPLAEQRRIVAKLDSLTARIARARAELERIKKLQKQWLQRFLDSEFSCSGRMLKLGTLAEDVRYGTAQKCIQNPVLTPVLRIPNISSGKVDISNLKHAKFTEKEIQKLSLLPGDVLIIRSNGSVDLVGQSAVVDEQASGFLFAGYLIRIRLKKNNVAPDFVHYWLQSSQARNVINAEAKSTSGVNNINSEQLKNLQIRVPSLSMQQEIVSRITKAFAHINHLETEGRHTLTLLNRLEASLLAKAFRGKLVPQDPNDEPASVLLERIRAERTEKPETRKRK
ncbi:restriction endonuclease subunit S [Acetobacter conturbans]|nr:restriction endonuclease subunit S [Acetobacter conturbans]